MQIKEKYNRRKFIASASAFSLASFFPKSIWGKTVEDNPNSVPVLKAGPYIQSFGQREVTICFITSSPCYGWVEYGDQANKMAQKAESITNGLIDAYHTIHKITIEDLLPEQRYYYRICIKEIDKFGPYKIVFGEEFYSSTHSFKPICNQMKKVSFLVFNDIHDRPESFRKLLQFQKSEKRDFVLLNGDILNHIDTEEQIAKHLIEPLSEGEASTPIYFSRGNHETRGIFARNLNHYLGKGKEGYYFSFLAGPVYCIVLDSGEDKTDNDPEYFGLVKFDQYREKQKKWLKEEIQKKAFKEAKYKVVFSHIPMFYSGSRHGTLHCRELWADLLNEAKIDMLISGHTHTWGIYPATEEHHYPIVIGGGPEDGQRTMIEVNASSKHLELKIIDDTGKVQKELIL